MSAIVAPECQKRRAKNFHLDKKSPFGKKNEENFTVNPLKFSSLKMK